MDLSDALDGGAPPSNLQAGGPAWPGQPQNPTWPGQPQNPTWPGQPQNPTWPGQPQNPTWPGQPQNPTWPGQQPNMPPWPNQPNQPAWPGQPNAPGWPGQFPQTIALTVPYEMPLPHGVCDRMLFTIHGEPTPNSQTFSINLYRNKDVAFHLNPRFDENGITVIVRNTKVNNAWGAEERAAPSFPFARGKPFEVKILCTQNEYKVAVNKTHLLEYKHRVRELKQINQLTVYGDVKLTSVNVETLP